MLLMGAEHSKASRMREEHLEGDDEKVTRAQGRRGRRHSRVAARAFVEQCGYEKAGGVVPASLQENL